jgi:hypothetical protein
VDEARRGGAAMTRAALIRLVITALWTLLWFAPPGSWLPPQLGMGIALLLFIVPGAGLHALVAADDERPGMRLILGFAFSVALTGVLGLAGGVACLPFGFVMNGLWAVGAAALLVARPPALPRPRETINTASLLDHLPALVAVLTAARLCMYPAAGSDDFTHLGRVNAFLNATALGFQSLAFGDGATIPPRYWLAYWPLCEAVLAAKSGIAPIELNKYLGVLLAPLAFLGVYQLASNLGLGRPLAGFAVIAQLAALIVLTAKSQPGHVFFHRLTEDKVMGAFVLMPACLASAAWFFCRPTLRRLLTTVLVYLSVALCHPTLLGIGYLVTLVYGAIELIVTPFRKHAAALLALLTLMVGAVSVLRFVQHPSRELYEFSLSPSPAEQVRDGRMKRLEVADDGKAYTVARRVVPGEARIAGALVLTLALLHTRAVPAARYLAAALATVGLTLVPQTSWILASVLTPFHLWRVSWQTPFGIGLAFLIYSGRRLFPDQGRWVKLGWLRAFRADVFGQALLLAGALSVVAAHKEAFPALNLPPDWETAIYSGKEVRSGRIKCRRRYQDLIQIGRWIDLQAHEGGLVLGDLEAGSNEFLPSVSVRSRLLVFRGVTDTVFHGSVSHREAERRLAVAKRILHPSTPPDERLRLLSAEGIDYVLLCGVERWTWAEQLARETPEQIGLAAVAGDIRLYRVNRGPRPATSDGSDA